MQKEKLTVGNIQTDLRFRRQEEYKQLALFSALFLVALGLLIAPFKADDLEFAFKWMLLIVAEISLLFVIVRKIRNLAMLHKSIKMVPCVVKDKLVNAEYKGRYRRKLRDERYLLHFSKYGNYIVPIENYIWSAFYAMDDKAVVQDSSSGDEFYLVLSHTDKILLAYNTKMFEFEEWAS